METTASFGYWLRRQRKSLDLTQRTLAQLVGCSLETIKKIESDQRRPSRQMAELLAEKLMLTPNERSVFVECAIGTRSPTRLALPQQPQHTPLHRSESHFHLPTQATALIGREQELARITAMVADPTCRLVSLVGPGGIGKTRLAVQAAGLHLQRFDHGVYFVSLIGVNTGAMLLNALLDTFHLPQQPAVSAEAQLFAYLHKKHLLLILDNFEHLQQEATLLTRILAAAPAIKLLVTSRERLQLREERLLPIAGLALPTTAIEALATASTVAAVQLFLQAAQRLSPSFVLTTDNMPAIVRICRLIEGIPLAIEFAAGWTRLLTCPAIEQQIMVSLEFLTTAWADTPERHRSMQTVLTHSWRLLTVEEREVLCQLAVFCNGFCWEAASAVANATPLMLARMVDKTWLHVNEGRFTMHELVRQFTTIELHRLDPVRIKALRSRHSRFFGLFLRTREALLRSHQQIVVMNELWAEIDNIRAGWHWAVETGQIDVIDQYLKSFQWVTEVRGWNQAMFETFAQAANQLEQHIVTIDDSYQVMDAQFVWAKTRHCQARHAIYLGQPTQAQQLCETSLAYFSSRVNDDACLRESAYVKLTLALAFFDQGKYANSEQICQETWHYFQTNSDDIGVGWSLWLLGLNNFTLGRWDKAEAQFAQNLATASQMGDLWGKAWALGMVSSLFIAKGDYRHAAKCAQESYHIRQTFGHRLGVAYSLLNLGEIAVAQKQYTHARQHYEEAVMIGEEISDPHVQGSCLRELSKLASLEKDYAQARQYLRESLQVFQSAGRQADVEIIRRELDLIPATA